MGRRKLATEPNIVWKRIELVMLVRTGQMSVREAAVHLNTSAKTYYAWERRIVAGAKREATDRSTGRPATVPNPELERAQATTIRLRLLKIGARIRITARRVWLSMASSFPLQRLFGEVWAALRC